MHLKLDMSANILNIEMVKPASLNAITQTHAAVDTNESNWRML